MLGLVEEVDGPPVVGPALSDLATAALVVAVERTRPSVRFAVVALGRFGGDELAYASDLDLLLVHGGRGPEDQAEAERVWG